MDVIVFTLTKLKKGFKPLYYDAIFRMIEISLDSMASAFSPVMQHATDGKDVRL